MFGPFDLPVITGDPARRRAFMDEAVVALVPASDTLTIDLRARRAPAEPPAEGTRRPGRAARPPDLGRAARRDRDRGDRGPRRGRRGDRRCGLDGLRRRRRATRWWSGTRRTSGRRVGDGSRRASGSAWRSGGPTSSSGGPRWSAPTATISSSRCATSAPGGSPATARRGWRRCRCRLGRRRRGGRGDRGAADRDRRRPVQRAGSGAPRPRRGAPGGARRPGRDQRRRRRRRAGRRRRRSGMCAPAPSPCEAETVPHSKGFGQRRDPRSRRSRRASATSSTAARGGPFRRGMPLATLSRALAGARRGAPRRGHRARVAGGWLPRRAAADGPWGSQATLPRRRDPAAGRRRPRRRRGHEHPDRRRNQRNRRSER